MRLLHKALLVIVLIALPGQTLAAAAVGRFHSLERNAVAVWETAQDGVDTYTHIAVGLQALPGLGGPPERYSWVNVARYDSWTDDDGFFHSFGGWGRGEGTVDVAPNLASASVSAEIAWEYCSYDEDTGIDACWAGPMMPISATYTATGPLELYDQSHDAFGSRWATFVQNSIVLRRDATASGSIGGDAISGSPVPEWTELNKSHMNVIMVYPPDPHG